MNEHASAVRRRLEYLLAVAALFAAIVVASYFLFYLPIRDTREHIREQEAQSAADTVACEALGRVYVASFDARFASSAYEVGRVIGASTYFNTSLNACLIDVETVSGGSGLMTHSFDIINLYSNENLADYNYFEGADTSLPNFMAVHAEFTEKERVLMAP